MGQHIRTSIQILVDTVKDSTGVDVAPVEVMEALLRAIDRAAPRQSLPVAIGHKRLQRSYAAAKNGDLARRVARWAFRALGHEATLRDSYPLYAAVAKAHGLAPWGFVWYQANAYAEPEGPLAASGRRRGAEATL